MRQLLQTLTSLATDTAFATFQNELAHCGYAALGQGYVASDNEVALVTRLVNALTQKGHGPIRLSAKKIHGSRSYVEFNYMDKPVTKELGDMAILTVATRGRQRLFQRLCIIQNKKQSSGGWAVDLEQLYLLKNFPTFTGNKGMFKNCGDLVFRNTTGCLGAFGLLQPPGEMIMASAPLVTECLRGKNTLAPSDLSFPGDHQRDLAAPFAGWAFPGLLRHFHPKDFMFLLEELWHDSGLPLGLTTGQGMPFLGNLVFMRDMHDFIRGWTQLNLGEVTFAFGETTNPHVEAFANFLARSAGFNEMFDIPADDLFASAEFDNEMGIFLMHLNVE